MTILDTNMTEGEVAAAKYQMLQEGLLKFITDFTSASGGRAPTDEYMAAFTVGFIDGVDRMATEIAGVMVEQLLGKKLGQDVTSNFGL